MSNDSEIRNKIIELTHEKSPETVEKLTEIASQELNMPRDIVFRYIMNRAFYRTETGPEQLLVLPVET